MAGDGRGRRGTAGDRGRWGTVGDGEGRRKTLENIGKQGKRAGEARGRQTMMGDGGGRLGMTQCRLSWSLALTCQTSSGKDGTG